MSTDTLADGLIRWRRWLLVLALLLGASGWWLSGRLAFDRSIENMFASDNPALVAYKKLQRTFGGNEVVLAVYRDPQLFARDGAGIERVAKTRERLEAIAGVKAVLSIDQPMPGAMITQDTVLARRTRELFRDFTHSSDGQVVSLVCMLDPSPAAAATRRETVEQMRAVMQSLPEGLAPGWLTGEPILLVDGFRYVEDDGHRLGIWSTLLLGMTIVACFRSLRWVVLPLLVVQWTLWMTRGLLVLLQVRLSMVSSMLTAVVMVVGVATMVHVLVRFSEARASGLGPRESLRTTLSALFWPIVWSCLTDAVGFLALTVSDVGPVRDFGLMMALGSMFVLVNVLLLVPGLALLGNLDTDPRTPWGEDRLVAQLQRLLRPVRARPLGTLLMLSIPTLLVMMGLRFLQVETDFTRNFRPDSDIAVSYQFVEENLGGAGVCDVLIPAPASIDWTFLQRLRRLEAKLRRLPAGVSAANADGPAGPTASSATASAVPDASAITKVFSLADALVELSPVDLGKQLAFVRVGMIQSGLRTMQNWMPEFYAALYGVDPKATGEARHYARLMLRVHERQSAAEKKRLIQRVSEVSAAEFPGAEVTGYFVLLAQLVDSVLQDQWRTFGVAILGIGLLMWIAFRSLRLALIALVPNTIPVMVVLGAMGWLAATAWPALRINMGTAMIAAVTLGLSIDSSIHYILRFQNGLRRGLDADAALEEVQQSVGKSLVFSTLALAVGFAVLATSRFIPTVYFGALVTLAMLGGLVGNLFVLPLLIQAFVIGRKPAAE